MKLEHCDFIRKPQLDFTNIDNSYNPFIPIYLQNPILSQIQNIYFSNPKAYTQLYAQYSKKQKQYFSYNFIHPFYTEISNFTPNCENCPLIASAPLNPNIKIIDQISELISLKNILENESEIAIDLEHHSYRSYQGFTCILQISTRKYDFVIDTIKLRNYIHNFLINVFLIICIKKT